MEGVGVGSDYYYYFFERVGVFSEFSLVDFVLVAVSVMVFTVLDFIEVGVGVGVVLLVFFLVVSIVFCRREGSEKVLGRR